MLIALSVPSRDRHFSFANSTLQMESHWLPLFLSKDGNWFGVLIQHSEVHDRTLCSFF